MGTATLSTKGQVVIPVDVRRAMGLNVGDVIVIDYDAEAKEAHLRKRDSWDGLAQRFSRWVKPGTPVLDSASHLYSQRPARQ